MLERTIWSDLIEWKSHNHHPLIVRGLRQVGKTFIVREFGKAFYDNVVYLDLRANRTIHKVFDGNFDVNQMVMSITASVPSARFITGRTLLILDEIQDCPNARSSLKYWDIDGRFDVIATGSFLGVKGFRTPYVRGVPVGYEEQVTMYPLTFREFLINTGMSQSVMDYVEKSIKEKTMIEKSIHEAMRQLYFQYLVVGGMPEVCKVFFDTHDLNAVRREQKRILRSIKDDFGRYVENGNDKINETLKLRAEACFNSIPSQLAKEYKKFQYSLVNVKGHSPEKADGLQYLEDVGLAIKAYNTNSLSSPLEGLKIGTEFKVYFSDTGLLVSQMGDDVPSMILSGNLGAYKGAIAENMVATALSATGEKLYYYHAPSGSPELDFLLERNEDIVIVECKSSNNRATSMKYVLSNPQKYGKHRAIKIADANVGEGTVFDTYPLYSLGFLPDRPKQLVLDSVDVKSLKVPSDSVQNAIAELQEELKHTLERDKNEGLLTEEEFKAKLLNK